MSFYVITVAGSGTIGHKDGPSRHSYFNTPRGIVIDKHGSVFVADRHNKVIRKITSHTSLNYCTVETVHPQKPDGSVDDKPFLSLDGISLDSHGNMYIADPEDHSVKKYVDNFVQTLFKNDELEPTSLCIDKESNIIITSQNSSIYKVDTSNNSMEKISGFIPRLWRKNNCVDGPSAHALFQSPSSCALDEVGNIWICDSLNDRIRKISSDLQTVTTEAGSSAGLVDGHKSQALFNRPEGLAFNSQGELFIADSGNHAIRKISKDGTVTTLVGGKPGFRDGPALSARFSDPASLAIDSDGNIWISDTRNHRIRKLLWRLSWNEARLVWIGHLKNDRSCPLTLIPKDIIRVIIRYC